MKYLFSRKHAGEEYKFYELSYVSWVTNKLVKRIVVHTPENCFGYTDTVFLDSDGTASSTYRYLQPWILRRLAVQMQAAAEKHGLEW